MKKINKDNPLKYFNDEKAKRVAKLTKAQTGVQMPQTEAAKNREKIISRYNELNKSIENTSPSYKKDLDYKKNLRENYIKSITGQDSIAKKTYNILPSPTFLDPATGAVKNKKGGQTKSKKK